MHTCAAVVNESIAVVMQVVKQCCMTDGVEPQYIKEEILPHFFRHFWNHRMALDRRNFKQVGLGPWCENLGV